jgi:hypothetical protein
MIHYLDALIAEHAPLLKLKRIDVVRERDDAGNVNSVTHEREVTAEQHVRAVWQYHFMKHPISM